MLPHFLTNGRAGFIPANLWWQFTFAEDQRSITDVIMLYSGCIGTDMQIQLILQKQPRR